MQYNQDKDEALDATPGGRAEILRKSTIHEGNYLGVKSLSRLPSGLRVVLGLGHKLTRNPKTLDTLHTPAPDYRIQ